MRALSIRQPYAELIPSASSGQALRGIKTVELRSRSTRIVGERFYIYACNQGHPPCCCDLVGRPARGRATAPAWMIELAEHEVGTVLPTERRRCAAGE
jgi:hypothetical protein